MSKCKCPKCENECNVYNDIESGMIIATKDDLACILIECPVCKKWRRFGFNVGYLFDEKHRLGEDRFKEFVNDVEEACIRTFMKGSEESKNG